MIAIGIAVKNLKRRKALTAKSAKNTQRAQLRKKETLPSDNYRNNEHALNEMKEKTLSVHCVTLSSDSYQRFYKCLKL